jgi:hypothetical protein
MYAYLQGALRGLLESSLDVIVRGGLFQPCHKVNDRYIGGWNTERKTAKKEGQRGASGRCISSYVSLPLSEGITLPTALAAPVDEGMMFALAPRPPRQSLAEGPSTLGTYHEKWN